MVKIYDKNEDRYFEDEDGQVMIFDSEVDAKNYLFTLEFTYEFVQASIEFEPM